MRTSIRCLLTGLSLSGALAVLPSWPLVAQTPTDNSATAAIKQVLVKVQTPMATFDPKTSVTKVRLYNPTNDTTVVELTTQFVPPSDKPLSNELVFDTDTTVELAQKAQMAKNDSLGRVWSLASWIKEPLPARIWIAPRQTVGLELHAQVPPGTKPGEYFAYFVVNTLQVTKVPQFTQMMEERIRASGTDPNFHGLRNQPTPMLIVSLPETVRPRTAAKLVYSVGATVAP